MKKQMQYIAKLLYKYFVFFLIGGCIYVTIEVLYRGHSHWTMLCLGGLCYIFIGLVNEILPWEMYIELQMAIGGIVVTMLELCMGIIVNIILKWDVWDYSNVPFNFLGQICLPFFFIWCLLSLPAILLDDRVRYRDFGEEKPRYTSWILEKITGDKD